jgi:hypothetical protein
MKPGDVTQMTSCTVVDGTTRFGFKPPPGLPRGTTMVFLFLGNRRPGEMFDPEAALQALGWEPKQERRKDD